MTLSHEILDTFGLADQPCTLIARRENTVYRAGDWVLRVHRPGYRTFSQITAELYYMRCLHQAGCPVPLPGEVRQINGHLYSTVRWLNGKTLPSLENLTPAIFQELGGVLKSIQAVSLENLDRPIWDRDAILGNQPLWGRWQDHPDLSRTQARLFDNLKPPSHLPDLQLIHADALRENVMLVNGRVHLIDFDDSSYSYPSFDLATVLVKEWGEPDFEAKQNALLSGYGKIDAKELAYMKALRALTYVGWAKDRIGEPGMAEISHHSLLRAEWFARAYTDGDYDRAA